MNKILGSISLLLLMVLLSSCATTFQRVDKHKDDLHYWPKTFEKEGDASLTLYQPQIIDWPSFTNVKARMVLSYRENPKGKLLYGTVEISANTVIDVPSKQVNLSDLSINILKVLSLKADETLALQKEIAKILPVDGLIMSLDRMSANFQRHVKSTKSLRLKATPPKIYVSKKPAALVILNGKPIWSPIKDNELQFAVNTNWDLFLHKKANVFYIRHVDKWYVTTSLQKAWAPVFKMPDAFYNLPKTKNWKIVKANLPKKPLSVTKGPEFLVSYKPAELILLEGEPQLKPLSNVSLSWVTNTKSDLFFSRQNKYYYYLVSGRWFRSKTLNNDSKWSFITDRLPDDFKKISRYSPRASVLASIPGTIEAQTAIIMAQVPHKVQVKKSFVKPKVVYVGKPDFKPIKSTELTYAVNTSSDVIHYKTKYYLCKDGIWFISHAAIGPWSVATRIPKAIYEMPASSPLYHTTYVYIYDTDVDTVTVGYTSGYSNVYVSWGVAVYGTGWYYSPYHYYDPFYYPYPFYYHYPYTYGANNYYNPNTGTYGRAGWAYGPYGGAGSFATVYNPTTGSYARAAAVYGPSGAGRWLEASNPRTNTRVGSIQGTDYYNAWGATAIKRDDKWAATGKYKTEQGKVRGFKTSEGQSGFVGRNENNLYAGKDGNVYRRNESGWQQYQNGNWDKVDAPVNRESLNKRADSFKQKHPDMGSKGNFNRDKFKNSGRSQNLNQLNRDFNQRQYGNQRLNQQRSWQSGGSSYQRPNRGSGSMGRTAPRLRR